MTSSKRRTRVRPYDWLVAGLLLTYVWRVQDLYPILAAIKFPAVVSFFALGLFLFHGYATRSMGRYQDNVVRGCLFLLAWMVLSVPGGVYPGLSFRFIVGDHIKTVLMMLMIISAVRTFKDVERLVAVQLGGAALYCVLILVKFEVGMNGRLGDLAFYDANDLSMLIVCTLPIAVYFMRPSATGMYRLMAISAAAVFVLATVKAGSRGGFLGLLAVAVYLLLAFRTISARVRIGAVAGCAVLLFAFAGPQYWQLMGTLLHPKDDYNWSGNNDVGRMAIWERGVGYIKDRPILGVGANAFPVAEGMLSEAGQRQQYGIGFKWSAAHNSFIQVGAELGLPGLIALLFALYHSVQACAELGRRHPRGFRVSDDKASLGQALVGTIVGYMVCGFFLSQGYSAYLYATFGIIVGLRVVAARDDTVTAYTGAALSKGATAEVTSHPRINSGRVARV